MRWLLALVAKISCCEAMVLKLYNDGRHFFLESFLEDDKEYGRVIFLSYNL